MRNEYVPLTLAGYRMSQEGVDSATVQEYEQYRLAVQSAEGQAALVARHPDAARPEIQQAIGAVMASDPGRFVTIADTSSPSDAFEIAYSHAMSRGRPAPASGGQPTGYGGGAHRPTGGFDIEARRQQNSEGERIRRETGSDVLAARAAGFSLGHPDLDVDPRR